MTSRIIHSGRLVERRKESTTFRRLACFSFFWTEVSPRIFWRNSTASSSISTVRRSSLMASAPICAWNVPCSSRALRYSSSVRSWFCRRPLSPGSMTTYASKYSTRSRSRSEMSSRWPMRLGNPLKNQT